MGAATFEAQHAHDLHIIGEALKQVKTVDFGGAGVANWLETVRKYRDLCEALQVVIPDGARIVQALNLAEALLLALGASINILGDTA